MWPPWKNRTVFLSTHLEVLGRMVRFSQFRVSCLFVPILTVYFLGSSFIPNKNFLTWKWLLLKLFHYLLFSGQIFQFLTYMSNRVVKGRCAMCISQLSHWCRFWYRFRSSHYILLQQRCAMWTFQVLLSSFYVVNLMIF